MTQSKIQMATVSYLIVFKIIDAVKRWFGLIGFIAFKNISQDMAYFIKIFVKQRLVFWVTEINLVRQVYDSNYS